MIFIDSEGITDPSLNLALEEHLLRNYALGEDLLLFYINEPSIIIGRNQNALEEINGDYVEAHNIHVVRRLSGGGTVYHDLGNLNFSFITENAKENVHNFRKFTGPVIAALQSLGIPAELGSRYDILVNGLKISGNAQYVAARRMVSHGTLLYNSDLSRVTEALQVKASKIESKSVKSVRSRVANICDFLEEEIDVETFRLYLLRSLFPDAGGFRQVRLAESDWSAVHRLADERYRNWDWNWGRSPDFTVQKTARFPAGEIHANIEVHNGRIRSLDFVSDFLGQGEADELARSLAGTRYTATDLAEALLDAGVNDYIEEISLEEFIEFLY